MSHSQQPVIVVLSSQDAARPTGIEQVAARAEIRWTDAAGLADALPGAGALLLWDFFSRALADAWPAADSLEWVHVAAAGVDTVLFDELRRSEVVLTNARGVFDRPIAEFVLASILAFTKDVHHSHDLQRARVWQHRETRRLEGSTALIVGTGGIGRATARLLRAVGMQVRGAGRTARTDDEDFGVVVPSADLAEHVGWADHLVVAAPLTDATRDLVDADVLAAMRRGAHLVNVGRGACVDEKALCEALVSGHLGGASLDVFRTEPLPADHPLWEAPGAVLTPHMSGDATGWRDALAAQFVDNALRWLDGAALRNVVDKELGYAPGGGRG